MVYSNKDLILLKKSNYMLKNPTFLLFELRAIVNEDLLKAIIKK